MKPPRSHAQIRTCLSLAIAALIWCHAPCSDAAPVGSPANLLEKGQWAMGLSGGGMRKRKMKGGAEVSVYEGGHFRGYGLTDRLSLYANIGGAYLAADDSSIPPNRGVKNGFGTNLVVDVALKAVLWRNARKDWAWDVSAGYRYLGSPHKKEGNQATWTEGQFATILAKSFGSFTPYAGGKLSLVKFDYIFRSNLLDRRGRYTPKTLFAPLVGFDWAVGEDHSTIWNLETSYLNGFEASLSLTKRF